MFSLALVVRRDTRNGRFSSAYLKRRTMVRLFNVSAHLYPRPLNIRCLTIQWCELELTKEQVVSMYYIFFLPSLLLLKMIMIDEWIEWWQLAIIGNKAGKYKKYMGYQLSCSAVDATTLERPSGISFSKIGTLLDSRRSTVKHLFRFYPTWAILSKRNFARRKFWRVDWSPKFNHIVHWRRR